MLSAAGSAAWLRGVLAAELADLEAEAAHLPPGSEGLFFAPYLAGERTPHPDPNARGARGLTPLHLAAERGDLKNVQTLIELGADIGARMDDDRTAHDLASEKRSTEIPYRLEYREKDRSATADFLSALATVPQPTPVSD